MGLTAIVFSLTLRDRAQRAILRDQVLLARVSACDVTPSGCKHVNVVTPECTSVSKHVEESSIYSRQSVTAPDAARRP